MRVSLFNAKNPNGKRVPVTIIVEHIDITSTNDGELIYLISLHTGAKSISGTQVVPVYINNVTRPNIFSEIEKGLSTIASQIDWGILENDKYPPNVTYVSPSDKEENVSINSCVYVTLDDPFPASFIDISTIKLKVNNIDVTSQVSIKQDGKEFKLKWIPIKVTN